MTDGFELPVVIWQFQFLIGKIIAYVKCLDCDFKTEFQFLIGKIIGNNVRVY